MVVRVDIRETIITGCLGPLRAGMDRDAVMAAVGEPDDFMGARDRDVSSIWRYGDFEVHFSGPAQRVTMVYVDDFDVLRGGSRIDVVDQCLQGGMSWKRVTAFLNELGVPWSEEAAPDDGQRVLRTESGVRLAVVNQKEEFGPQPGLFAVSWHS